MSFVMHGALVLVIYLTATSSPRETTQAGQAAATVPQVEMVYIPPLRQAQPAPEQPISRPDPDAVQSQDDQRALTREQADAPPALAPRTTTPPPLPEPEREPPETVRETAPRPPDPVPVPERPTMESEAQRIFGRPQLRRQQENPDQLGVRMGILSDRNEQARRSCVPKPRDPNAPIEMAELVGRVWYDEARTRPLPGAFLQIVGTSYSAYSDRTGLYRLVFDASLVDECRTQYVRVVAAGYTGKNLVLGLGPGVNDVVMGR